MHGYCLGTDINPFMNSFSTISPQPLPPTRVAMTTPIPVPPDIPRILLAISSSSVALATPIPKPPNSLFFLGPLPEPPDIAFKKYNEYLEELKKEANVNGSSFDADAHGVMLAVCGPSVAMATPLPIPPSSYIFLSPKPEPSDIAFKRYKDYLAELKTWTKTYARCVDDALSSADELEKAIQSF